MKRLFPFFLVFLAAALVAAGTASGAGLTSKVDPFIGTGGHGHTFPGPSLPFGMIQPGPDTRLSGWDGCSGYHHDDTRLYGFSHTHLSGTGASDYGDVLLMPVVEEGRWERGDESHPGYSSRFRHETETARPGYYAVTLDDPGVRVELTATRRAGFHRYTYPAGKTPRVVLDLTHRDEVLESSLTVVSDSEVEGMRRSRKWTEDQRLFFVIRFSRPFTAATDGKNRKAIFSFGEGAEPLLVKVGISAVDAEGARRNLDAEIPEWDFDEVKKAADRAWEKELAKVQVSGGTPDEERIFYTALYHCFLAPNLYSDVDGRYRGRDLAVHAADFDYYTVFSLWDTFRALHPLLSLVDRKRTADFVKTFLRQFEEGGRLPVWELAANETDCMIGYHAVSVIADAMVKGIDGFDPELAFRAMVKSAEESRYGLAAYKRDGYIDAGAESENVSRTLEYAYDDWCIAQVAAKLGKQAEADGFLRRAQAYLHLYDPSTGFFRPRLEGHWWTPFDPFEVNFNYTEGNAWQYAFFVPQDVDGLMALHGGPAAFAKKLDALFSAPKDLHGVALPDVSGLVGQYAHGNEPSHHLAYLWSYAGERWKTESMVRRLREEMYAALPDGLAGNEDCGQMSAWYVLSALGLYEVTPGSGEWVIGTPLFPKATVRLENGKKLVLRARHVSKDAPYVGGARWNGKPWKWGFVHDSMLAGGGTLDLEMVVETSSGWGVAPGERPRSAIVLPRIVPAPFVTGASRTFRGTAKVAFGDAEKGAAIRLTRDGSEPTKDSELAAAPIPLEKDATLRAAAFRADGERSPAVSFPFHRIPDGRTVRLSAQPTAPYQAGGPDALIDSLRGGEDFRRGRWQGFQGTDLLVTVDLGRARDVRRVALGFLQDAASGILMPRHVTFSVSDDGEVWRELGGVVPDVAPSDMRPGAKDLEIRFSPSGARYVRANIVGAGPLPPGHPSAGKPSFFFTDEIVIDESDLTVAAPVPLAVTPRRPSGSKVAPRSPRKRPSRRR